MPNALRRHALAPALLGALLVPGTPAMGPVALSGAQESGSDQEDAAPEVVFAELTFEDAISRAERTQTMLVILWVQGKDTPHTVQFRDGIFGDRAVRQWMAAHATAVRIDANVDKSGARGNAVKEFPTVDILDLGRGGRVDRLTRGTLAIDFLAAVLGAADGVAASKPTGADATEPFRWLAWANARMRSREPGGLAEAVDGYAWCLQYADKYRPEFRARYLEFLLKRIAGAKLTVTNASLILNAEHNRLAELMRSGEATRRDVYELTRIDVISGRELDARDLYIALGQMGDAQRRSRAGLFDLVAPILGRYRQYEEVLAGAGPQPVKLFEARVLALGANARTAAGSSENVTEDGTAGAHKPQPPESADPTGVVQAPLRYTIPDGRANIIDDASWVYEALLSEGRGGDAKELLAYLGETYPLGRTYGLFMERALRLEMWSLAAEIADTGMSVVDERGRGRLQRLLGRIPVDDD